LVRFDFDELESLFYMNVSLCAFVPQEIFGSGEILAKFIVSVDDREFGSFLAYLSVFLKTFPDGAGNQEIVIVDGAGIVARGNIEDSLSSVEVQMRPVGFNIRISPTGVV
jgi:hypothetical protein